MLDKIWEKSRLNDTLIAGLISYAGFGTFFPKLVNGFASLNGTSDFETLTWFGMGYFLLPAFLFLAYWNGYEFRNVITDKLNLKNEFPSIGLDSTIFFVIVKLIPVAVFFVNPYILYDISHLWVLIYGLIGISEYWVYAISVKEVIEKLKEDSPERQDKVRQEMLQYGVLISFLNLFLGIGMLYFTEPWYLYRDGMIIIISIYLLFYGICVYGVYLIQIRKYPVIKGFLTLPVFLFLALIYCLPHVNRSLEVIDYNICHTCSEVEIHILLFLLITSLILFVKLAKDYYFRTKSNEKRDPRFWKGIGYNSLLVFLFCLLPFVAKGPLDEKSKSYFEKRLKAANEITDKKLIPELQTENKELTDVDRVLFRFVHKNNHFLRMYGNWKNDTIKYDSIVSKINFTTRMNLHLNECSRYAVIKTFNKMVRAREFYYGKYQRDLLGSRDPGRVNKFYSDLFTHLKDNVFPKTIIPLAKDSGLKDISNFYTHPLNYYSYVVNHYADQVSKVDSVIHSLKYIEYLNRIEKTENGQAQILGEGTSTVRNDELVAKAQNTLKGITEFMYKKSVLTDSDLLTSPPVKAFEYFKSMKQEQFFDRIRSAQVIYQSYLYDYQRIGVFLFLLQLVVLGFTWFRIKQDFVPAKNGSSQADQTSETKTETDVNPQKVDDHAVAVAFIVVLALLFPLMREIKAENIDPQKKFWMLNLSNWYMPGFVLPELPPLKELEEEKKKEQGSNVQFDNSRLYFLEDTNTPIEESTDLLNLVRSIDYNLKELKNKGIPIDNSELSDVKKLTEEIQKVTIK